jgi:hypothetical protein
MEYDFKEEFDAIREEFTAMDTDLAELVGMYVDDPAGQERTSIWPVLIHWFNARQAVYEYVKEGIDRNAAKGEVE